ncbi:MAG: hypothetical protein COB49_09450 [Alphaproteobacteria bacterium]|nr:MAG: hypothetical protein COB49_09450 [Alphaproteobacteria bacterium]
MSLIKKKRVLVAALICGVTFFAANVAQATPMVGSISTVQFGTGNSADNWIVDTIQVGQGTVEIAIKAKNRFIGDIIPTSGFVFQAEAGNPPVSGSNPTLVPGLTIWNFEWSAIFTGVDAADFNVILGADFKPNDPDLANRFFFDVTAAPELSPGVFQDSQNLGFSFWQGLDPAIMPIDPFAAGTYQFSIELVEVTGQSLSRIDMTVQVPEPGAVALFGLGLLGLVALRRRRTI